MVVCTYCDPMEAREAATSVNKTTQTKMKYYADLSDDGDITVHNTAYISRKILGYEMGHNLADRWSQLRRLDDHGVTGSYSARLCARVNTGSERDKNDLQNGQKEGIEGN